MLVFSSMEYWDEAGERPVDADSRPELIVPLFSTKRLLLDGVAFYSDEFSTAEPPPGAEPYPVSSLFSLAMN